MACFSALLQERLLPVDTVRAAVAASNGASGTLSMSFGTEFGSGLEVEVVTTAGKVTWSPTGVNTVRKSSSGEKVEDNLEMNMENGIVEEFEAFAKSIASGVVDPRQSAAEGLRDLQVLEALLRSGEAGAVVKTVG